jgi:hypothetical protein
MDQQSERLIFDLGRFQRLLVMLMMRMRLTIFLGGGG